MRIPEKHTCTSDWLKFVGSASVGFSDGVWAPARAIDPPGWLWTRLKLAWAVFTGRADALFWVRQ